MTLTYGSIVIADGITTHLHNLRFNGRRQVQEAPLLRAAAAKLFNRGNASLSISFDISAQWDTLEEAELAFFLLWANLPAIDTAVFTCGGDSTVTFANAILEGLGATQTGVRIGYQFALRASAVTSSNHGLDSINLPGN